MVMTRGGGNGGGNYERPAPGMHLAVWAHTYEVGVHEREWKGTKKKATMLCIVWELESQNSKGQRFTMFDVVPASTYGNSKSKAAIEACIRRPLTESEIDNGFDTAKAEQGCAMLILAPGKSDPTKVYINRRDMVQDANRKITKRGKYGPGEPIPGYVWAVMESADEGTVPQGQGTPPVKGERGAAAPDQPDPADTQGADGQDDIPF